MTAIATFVGYFVLSVIAAKLVLILLGYAFLKLGAAK
jgi:hypothetical protein